MRSDQFRSSPSSNAVPTPTPYAQPQQLSVGRLHPASAAQARATNAALTQPAQRARVSPTGVVQFVLDPDIRLACEDQAQAHSVEFDVWLQDAVNQALRSMLGI